jgi:hypothetical protein
MLAPARASEHRRAMADENGHYCFAVALWCRSLPRAQLRRSATACAFALRRVATAWREVRQSDFDLKNQIPEIPTVFIANQSLQYISRSTNQVGHDAARMGACL